MAISTMFHGDLGVYGVDKSIEVPPFINEYRSIHQYKENIIGKEFLFIPNYAPIEWIIVEFDADQNDILDTVQFVSRETITHNESDLYTYPLTIDIDFYDKMHQPKQNRYVWLKDHHTIYESINFVFKEPICAKMNLYISSYHDINFHQLNFG